MTINQSLIWLMKLFDCLYCTMKCKTPFINSNFFKEGTNKMLLKSRAYLTIVFEYHCYDKGIEIFFYKVNSCQPVQSI